MHEGLDVLEIHLVGHVHVFGDGVYAVGVFILHFPYIAFCYETFLRSQCLSPVVTCEYILGN